GLIVSTFEADPPPFFLRHRGGNKECALVAQATLGDAYITSSEKGPRLKAATKENRRAHEAEASPTDKSVGLPTRGHPVDLPNRKGPIVRHLENFSITELRGLRQNSIPRRTNAGGFA